MKKLISYTLLLTVAIFFNACKKEIDKPIITDITGHKVYSASELRSVATCTNNCAKRFTADVYFIGVVVADEVSGNFYKELYVRDRYNTGAIHLDLTTSSSYFIGDSIRVNLKGLDVGLNATTGMLEIDSLDHEKYLVKFASGANPQPRMITITQLNAASATYLCDLIQINNAGFIPVDTNQIWADPIAQTSINRTIKDCDGGQLIVRTSNYAKFAQQRTPSKSGSIIGIATAYQGTNQMAIRTPNELNMTGSGCTIYVKKDFEDNSLTSGGWSQIAVTNSLVNWVASSFSTDKFAKISGYVSATNQNSESWLISPSLNLSNAVNPIMNFITAAKFNGDVLEVWISTNYTSGLPGTATWTQLSGFNFSPNNPGSYVWTPSGTVSLSSYKQANVRVAFKYKSTTAGATTYEVDDVLIREN